MIDCELPSVGVIHNGERLVRGLIFSDGMAELLSVSPRSLGRLVRIGKIPQPIYVSKKPCWLQSSVQCWIDMGCPKCTPDESE